MRNRGMKKWYVLGTLVFLMVAAAEIWGIGAASAAPFYEGKTIVFVVNSGAGGGTDLFARVHARFLSRYIPGHPSIIVENRTGGAGILATNYVYGKAKPDGLTVATVTSGDIGSQLNQADGVNYDVTKMPVITAVISGTAAYVRPDLTKIKERKDFLKTTVQIIGGSPGIAEPHTIFQQIFISELLSVKNFRFVAGWKGVGDRRIAFERGEINYHSEGLQTYRTAMLPLVMRGTALPLFQTGIIKPNGTIVRAEVVRDVPTVEEFYKELIGKMPTGVAWEVVKHQIMVNNYNKSLVCPPGTPGFAVDQLRQAIQQLSRDPEWLKETDMVFGSRYAPPETMSGEEAGEIVKSILNPPKETRDFLFKWVHSK